MKSAICNTFTEINFVTGDLQRVYLDFKQWTIVLKFPESSFPKTYFNDCFCPYRMKLPSFCSLLTNSAFTHFFFFFALKKFSYNVLNVAHIFFFSFIICNPVCDDCYLIFNRNGPSKESHLLFTKCLSYFFFENGFYFSGKFLDFVQVIHLHYS